MELVINQRRKMLNAMESNAKENDNFATKMISTENAEKKCGRSKKKESNLLSWATSLKVTFAGKILCSYNFNLECAKNDLFEQMIIIITNTLPVYFACYSRCITWTRLLMHI